MEECFPCSRNTCFGCPTQIGSKERLMEEILVEGCTIEYRGMQFVWRNGDWQMVTKAKK